MIHYHGTPCGWTRKEAAQFMAGRHVFIPFPRPEDIATAAEVCQSFAIDNGAYSIWKESGESPSDWSEYYSFVRQWMNHPAFDWAVIPDVIDGDEDDNDDLIEKWPTDLINCGVPVWHLHESLHRLRRLAVEYQTIAIGSSGNYRTPGTRKWWNRMDEVWDEISDNGVPYTRVHGLRMLDAKIFSRIPFRSADSTNAVRNASNYKRYGHYVPPSAATRMSIIAERIEAHQSPAIYVPVSQKERLFYEPDQL